MAQASVSPPSDLETESSETQIRKGVSHSMDPAVAAQELYDELYQPDISFCLFYCSREYDIDTLGKELYARFGDVNMIGCTTAGEITPTGYKNGSLTGVSISGPSFKTAVHRIDNLSAFEMSTGEQVGTALRRKLEETAEPANSTNSFGFMLIDGLSGREEVVISSIYRSVGEIPLFGGSAGDGVEFDQTWLYHEGEFHTDCAILTLMQTDHAFSVFKTQHFIESDKKMVVTEADPERRIVTEINGQPAGREYARMFDLEVSKLTPLIFATYPVIVKIGGEFFVRSIQKVNDDESLTFFCAIDEGIVLTVAEGVDMVENLEQLFGEVREEIGEPALVLGCDCILRHLELEQKGMRDAISRIMEENNVIGFSTYGEQYNAMHVNQTFTGVAIGTKKRTES